MPGERQRNCGGKDALTLFAKKTFLLFNSSGKRTPAREGEGGEKTGLNAVRSGRKLLWEKKKRAYALDSLTKA